VKGEIHSIKAVFNAPIKISLYAPYHGNIGF